MKHVKCVLIFIGISIWVPAAFMGGNLFVGWLIDIFGQLPVGVTLIALFVVLMGFITRIICKDLGDN